MANTGGSCSVLSSDQMPPCEPLLPSCSSCVPGNLGNLLNSRTPVMAGFVYDTDVRSPGDQPNLAAIASAVGTQITDIMKQFPIRIMNAFVVPLGQSMFVFTSLDYF